MITLDYEITINRSPETVWKNLWNDETYRQWTSAFMEGSYAESSWQEGDRITFRAPDNNGMFGIIEKKIPNKAMVFRHQGEIIKGVEEKRNWADATEGYELVEVPAGTHLKIHLTMDDGNDGMKPYFNESFPKALEILKKLCENS